LFRALFIGSQDYLQRNGLLPVFGKLWKRNFGVPCGFEEIAIAAGEIQHPLIFFARSAVNLEESYLAIQSVFAGLVNELGLAFGHFHFEFLSAFAEVPVELEGLVGDLAEDGLPAQDAQRAN
jgi:hypothetical protein